MPDIDQLTQIGCQIRDGVSTPAVTVREFLSWFGAQRRGYWIVNSIRETLSKCQLVTEPDFESAYLDAVISFVRAREEVAPTLALTGFAPTVSVSVTAGAALKAPPSYADPTYRISKLPAANNRPAFVAPDVPLMEAVTIMLTNDFSQLPVMTSERDVKGVISWASVGERLALGRDGGTVRELMDATHQEIRADASLFEAVPIVVQHQYVLVRGSDNRICGIITGSDLGLQFQQLAEPFLLLGEIENHIRRLIADRFTKQELTAASDPDGLERRIDGPEDLSFGEYVRLLENPDRWTKLNLRIDRATFCKGLDRVRGIRNDVMHFDPDGVLPADLDRLRDFTRFLQRLQVIGVP